MAATTCATRRLSRLALILSVVTTCVMAMCALPGFTQEAHADKVAFYTYEIHNGEAVITDCDNTILSGIVIPDMLGGCPVTSIGDRAFECTSLTSVEIPSSVTKMGEYAFYGCSRLESVKIPSSITSISEGAFSNCGSLTNVVIPEGVTSIGDGAFSGCSNLESVSIPSTVTSIGAGAFADCTKLTSIDIPNSVTSIGNGAFDGCTNLKSARVSSNIFDSIKGYDSIESIEVEVLPSVETIGTEYQLCTKLTSVVIGDGVTSIGDGAFAGCENLASVTIPSSVTSIGDKAFENCTSLTNIEIPSSVTSIGDGAFSGCKNLTGIEIPSSVTSIGDNAFAGCEDLASVTIPDSVTSIGAGAFSGCEDLSSITIPASVTEIGEGAFDGCTNLGSISYGGTSDQWDAIVKGMGGLPKYIVLTILIPSDTPKDDGGSTGGNGTNLGTTTGGTGTGTGGATGGTSGTTDSTNVPISKATVTIASKTYTGKAQKPAVKVTYAGKTLVANTDYIVKYSSNKNVGTAKVTITGKGKYTGTVNKTFKVLPKKASIKKAKGGKKSITLRWSPVKTKMSKKRITGYQVRYSLKSNMGSAKVKTVKGYSKSGVTISKLNANKKYYVQVRTYMKIDGKNYFSAWSAKKVVRTS